MGILDRMIGIFGSSGENEDEDLDPEGMVQMLHMVVMPSYTTFIDRFPRLGEVTTDQYDFFATCAAVTAALLGIEVHRPEMLEPAKRSVENGLRRRWGPDGLKAVLDCNDFLNQAMEGAEGEPGELRDAIMYSLGMWIVWNLFQSKPTKSEGALVSVLGRMSYEVGSVYWSHSA